MQEKTKAKIVRGRIIAGDVLFPPYGIAAALVNEKKAVQLFTNTVPPEDVVLLEGWTLEEVAILLADADRSGVVNLTL